MTTKSAMTEVDGEREERAREREERARERERREREEAEQNVYICLPLRKRSE